MFSGINKLINKESGLFVRLCRGDPQQALTDTKGQDGFCSVL